MSQDRTEREYHLTPNGWVVGSFFVYGTKEEDVPAPTDRVETWIEEIDDSSGWAPPAVSWKRVWESNSVTPEARTHLNEKFPRPESKPWKKFTKKRKKLADYY